jgi:hypothetical protein
MTLNDRIADFLRSAKGGRYCDECVLKEVGADLVGARDETARIKNLRREFSVNRGICTRCQASKDRLLSISEDLPYSFKLEPNEDGAGRRYCWIIYQGNRVIANSAQSFATKREATVEAERRVAIMMARRKAVL